MNHGKFQVKIKEAIFMQSYDYSVANSVQAETTYLFDVAEFIPANNTSKVNVTQPFDSESQT